MFLFTRRTSCWRSAPRLDFHSTQDNFPRVLQTTVPWLVSVSGPISPLPVLQHDGSPSFSLANVLLLFLKTPDASGVLPLQRDSPPFSAPTVSLGRVSFFIILRCLFACCSYSLGRTCFLFFSFPCPWILVLVCVFNWSALLPPSRSAQPSFVDLFFPLWSSFFPPHVRLLAYEAYFWGRLPPFSVFCLFLPSWPLLLPASFSPLKDIFLVYVHSGS